MFSQLPAHIACSLNSSHMWRLYAASLQDNVYEQLLSRACQLCVAYHKSRCSSLRPRLPNSITAFFVQSAYTSYAASRPGGIYCKSFSWTSMSFCTRCSSVSNRSLSPCSPLETRCSSVFNRSLSPCSPLEGDLLSVLLCVPRLVLACLAGLLLSRLVLHTSLHSSQHFV